MVEAKKLFDVGLFNLTKILVKFIYLLNNIIEINYKDNTNVSLILFLSQDSIAIWSSHLCRKKNKKILR